MPIWPPLPKQVFQLVSDQPLTTVIDLLRHGDVKGGRKYRGQLDDPLSELGWQQLRATTSKKQNWQHIISSPLQRCAAFAEELSQREAIPLNIENGFKEVSFGLWEGKTADQLLKSAPEEIKKYWNDPVHTTPPQGENLIDFEKRILQCWNNMVTNFQGEHILVLSHAGVMRIILCHILGMSLTDLFKLDIGLAKASRIQIDNVGGESWPRLIFHGSEFI